MAAEEEEEGEEDVDCCGLPLLVNTFFERGTLWSDNTCGITLGRNTIHLIFSSVIESHNGNK